MRRDRTFGNAHKRKRCAAATRIGRTAEHQEYRGRRSDTACPGRQDHCRDEQTEKLFEFEVGDARSSRLVVALFLNGAVYSDFREAISMEKRYFTSDLSILS